MDKQKQIEEMTELMANWALRNNMCWHEGHAKALAETFNEENYCKIPEGAVVIPKEVFCYDNVEERIRTFNLDGNKVDFTYEQIMALTTIFHYKELQEKEIRKETAEKFAEKLIEEANKNRDNLGNRVAFICDIENVCKEITGE